MKRLKHLWYKFTTAGLYTRILVNFPLVILNEWFQVTEPGHELTYQQRFLAWLPEPWRTVFVFGSGAVVFGLGIWMVLGLRFPPSHWRKLIESRRTRVVRKVILPLMITFICLRLPGVLLATEINGQLIEQDQMLQPIPQVKTDTPEKDNVWIAIEVMVAILLVLWFFGRTIDYLIIIIKNWLFPPKIPRPPPKNSVPGPGWTNNPAPGGFTNQFAALIEDSRQMVTLAEPPPPDPVLISFTLTVPEPGTQAAITTRVSPVAEMPLELFGLTNSLPDNNYANNGAQIPAAQFPLSAEPDVYRFQAPGFTNLVTLLLDRTTNVASAVWEPCLSRPLQFPVGARVRLYDTQPAGPPWFYRFRFVTP